MKFIPFIAILLLLSGCYVVYMDYYPAGADPNNKDYTYTPHYIYQDSTVTIDLGIPGYSQIGGYTCGVSIDYGNNAKATTDSVYVQDIKMWFTNKKGKLIETASGFEVYSPKNHFNSNYQHVSDMPDSCRGSYNKPNQTADFQFNFDCSDFGYYKDAIVHCTVDFYINGRQVTVTGQRTFFRVTRDGWIIGV